MRESSLGDFEDEWEFEAPQFCDFAIDQLLDADPNNFTLFGSFDWVITPQKADNWFQQYHWLHESKQKQQELQAQQPLKFRNIAQPAFVGSPVLPSKQHSSTPPFQSFTSHSTTTFSSPKSTAHDNDFANTPRRRAARVPKPPISIPASSPNVTNNQQQRVSISQLQRQFEGRRNSLENLLNGFIITKPVIDDDSDPEEATSDNSSLSDYNDRNSRYSNDSLSDLLDSDEEEFEAPPRNTHVTSTRTIQEPLRIVSITGHNDAQLKKQEKIPSKNKKPALVDVDDVVNDLLQDLDLHLEKVASGADESDSEQAHPSGSLSPQHKHKGGKPREWNNEVEDSYFVVHGNPNKKKETPAFRKKEPTIKLRKPKETTPLSNISNQSIDSSKPEWKRDFSEIARIYKSATQVTSSINLMSTQNPQISFCPAPQKKKGGKVKKTIAGVKPAKESPPVQQFSVNVEAIEAEVAKMLAEHNKKFKPKSTYEPRKYGVKEIRIWEAESGKKWLECSAAEREEANEWISVHI